MNARRTAALGATALLLLGCNGGESRPPGIHFTDMTAASGISFSTTSGNTPSREILEVKGGGLALIDYDGDGDLDVFVPNGATMADPERGPGCRLFENLGRLQFRDATEEAGLTFQRWGVGVAVGDYDGDGHDDLYVTCYGPNALLRNTGDGRFEDVTDASGVAGNEWSTAASFGDLDGDEDLDLYVANYLQFDIANPPPRSTFKGAPVFTGPIGLIPQADLLYENLGGGSFRDVSESSGCRSVAPGFGLGAVILDFDGDGLQDIYVGNDSTANFLFTNKGGLRFEDHGLRSGLAANIDGSTQSTMGIAIGDVNESGFPSIFTTNFSNDTNTLHVNKGNGFFDDETRRYGLGMLAFPLVGWAAGFYDFDHDADEDLLLFNGHVYPNATFEAMDSAHVQPPLLFKRQGECFMSVTAHEAGAWLAEAHCDRGAAFGDLDRDGDIDAVVLELNGPLRVLRNDSRAVGDWLIVELEPKALGSKIEVDVGGDHQTRWISSGGSFVSASAQYAHFGVQQGYVTADVTVTWPDGQRQNVSGVGLGQYVVVARPE